MKFETILSKMIDDAAGLVVVERKGEIISVEGYVCHQQISFHVIIQSKNVTDKASSTPRMRGTISVIDPKNGEVLESEMRRRKGARNIKASKDVKLLTSTPKDVAERIAEAAKKLWDENCEQLSEAIKLTMPVGMITPEFAIASYSEQYIAERHSDSSENANKKRRNILKSVGATLPNSPMSQISSEDIKAWKRKNDISDQKVNELRDFWSFCLAKRICVGDLPFDKKVKTRNARTGNKLNEKAASLTNLSYEVWQNMIDKLFANEKTALGCGIMLIMSGFDWEDIEKLTWADVLFEDNTALIRYFRNELSGAKHDFSRDLFYDAAEYLYEYKQKLISIYDKITIENSNILSILETGKKITKKSLSEEARKLMLSAGIKRDFFSDGGKTEVTISLITNTYKALLKSKCGLKYDADTVSFLTGQVMQSSTFTSYESHTSPEARERMRVIMRPLSRPRTINRRHTRSHENGRELHHLRPDSTAEIVGATIIITLQPGEEISIYSKHGIEGRLTAEEG